MVVTADARATEAALEILKQGGNAVDAAITAQWVLNVVEPASSGIGGGGFFLFYEAATKRIFAFDGREGAPARAFPEMFLDEKGEPIPFYPERITGGLAVGVPGTLKLLKTVHEKYGSGLFSFADLFNPAIDYAENGFLISKRLASFIRREEKRLRMFPESKKHVVKQDGSLRQAGDRLSFPDLAETFQLIQAEGIDVFYRGEIARDIVRAVQSSPTNPGWMTLQDLSEYEVIQREPISGEYRGYQIVGMGPPSSGTSTVIAALNLLEASPMTPEDSLIKKIGFLARAQRLAFEDRNRFIGDPAFTNIPVSQIISQEYANKRWQEMSEVAQATTEEGTHTSHLSIMDEQGNMVAFTTTIEYLFGSALMVPGRGFFLNNELTDFDGKAFNTSGRLKTNAPEGKKRPRSSMSPTFVFQGEKPFLILGSPGGSAIIGAVFNVIVHVIDLQMSLKEAVHAPRTIHRGGKIELETPLFNEKAVRQSFHDNLKLKKVIGNVQAIQLDPATDVLIGQSDPRGEGTAQGY